MSTSTDDDKQDESTPQGMQAKWRKEIDAAAKNVEKFHKSGDRINRVYLDKRDGATEGASKINLFWSNTQVLAASLYAKPPAIDVSRQYSDPDDDEARVAAVILERILNNHLEADNSPFDTAVRQCVQDWMLPGAGIIWTRYHVETGAIELEEGEVAEPAEPLEEITEEDACTDYVYWKDFLWSPARTWQEMRWVGRRVYMSRSALVKRFGKKIGSAVPMQQEPKRNNPADTEAHSSAWKTAEVYEIWCKETRKVYWYCKDMDVILDAKDDPLDLEQFFPCPQPLCANLTTTAWMPRGYYVLVQDLYEQINEAQTRIKYLVKACKMVGVYNANAPAISRVFNDASETQLIPVDNWAMFAETGGVKGAIDFVPIDMAVTVIAKLREDVAAAKQELYEVSGISDIMRGQSEASETATAQQIKAQFGSARLQHLQGEVGRFARDALRLKAEIIAKHFQPETIIKQSNAKYLPKEDHQYVQGAVELIKNDDAAQYRINIEDESMALVDWANERDARTQFLGAVGQFVEAMAPLVQTKPEAAPAMLKLLQWGLAGFRVGKEIEGVIDSAITAMEQAGPPQPSPGEQAGIAKTKSETAKNLSQADKNMADAQRTTAGVGLDRANTMLTAQDQMATQDQAAMDSINAAAGAPPGGVPPGAQGMMQ